MADGGAPSARRFLLKRWRPWLRALHRDAGYLAIGLTVIYAVSGIAINHIGDWNPNFATVESEVPFTAPLPEDETEAGVMVLDRLGIDEEVRTSFYESDSLFEVRTDERILVVDSSAGVVRSTEKKERFFLRVANWLHENRGKPAWTYIADGYAVFLLFLAFSGIFMLRGRKGFLGRGLVLVAIGVAVPVLYVTFAGGP